MVDGAGVLAADPAAQFEHATLAPRESRGLRSLADALGDEFGAGVIIGAVTFHPEGRGSVIGCTPGC